MLEGKWVSREATLERSPVGVSPALTYKALLLARDYLWQLYWETESLYKTIKLVKLEILASSLIFSSTTID